MPIPKLGEPLDTDTVPDMVLVDMEVTVLVLPAMEVTDLDGIWKRSADADSEAWGTLGYGYGSGYGLGGYGGYGLGVASYGGYGLGHGIWKRSADADAWYGRGYGGYGGYGYGGYRYGK